MIFISLLSIFWASPALRDAPWVTDVGTLVEESAPEVCPGIGPCCGSCRSLFCLLCLADACAAFSTDPARKPLLIMICGSHAVSQVRCGIPVLVSIYFR
jgi:hypothetical protein